MKDRAGDSQKRKRERERERERERIKEVVIIFD